MSQPIVIPCPNCGGRAEVEVVDVGVGLYYNPEGYVCPCGWQEGNWLDYMCTQLTMEEIPSSPLSASAH